MNYKFMTGKILIRKTASNFIVTFTDLFGKVIYCATSFASLIDNNMISEEDFLFLL
jgi:ribosomal protein S11